MTDLENLCWNQLELTHKMRCRPAARCTCRHIKDESKRNKIKLLVGGIACRKYLSGRCQNISCKLLHVNQQEMEEYRGDGSPDTRNLPRAERDRIMVQNQHEQLHAKLRKISQLLPSLSINILSFG